MADGREHSPGSFSFRATFPWMDIFRCFQVAIDPRKLLVAAAGILTMSFGWYVLSACFYYKAPDPNETKYSNKAILDGFGPKINPRTNLNYTRRTRPRSPRKLHCRLPNSGRCWPIWPVPMGATALPVGSGPCRGMSTGGQTHSCS
jgi:hypothetical protein